MRKCDRLIHVGFASVRQRLGKLFRVYFLVVVLVFIKNGNGSHVEMTEMVQLKEMFWKLGSMLSLMNQISPDYWWPAATGHRDFVSYWTISPLIAWICVSPVVCEWFRTRVCSWLKLMAVVVVATVFRILFQNMYGTSNHAVGGLYVYGKTSLLGYMDSFVLGVFLFYRYHARNGNNNGASTISNGIRMGNMPYCHGSGTMVFVALGLLWFMLGCTYEDFVDLHLLSRNGSSVLSHLARNNKLRVAGHGPGNTRARRTNTAKRAPNMPVHHRHVTVHVCTISILWNLCTNPYFRSETTS